MRSEPPKYVLWEWNVRVHSFDQQVAAAAAGGFDVLTLPYRKYMQEAAVGRSARELRAFAAEQGVTLDFLDGMSGWTSVRYPPGADAFLKSALDFGADEALELCDAAGLRHIVAIAGFAPGALTHAELVDDFARFCERAADAKIWVDLEAMPMLGIPTLRSAWDVVREAGSANSGLMFDSWHFVRGAADMNLLASIPRGRIANIQIVDGSRDPRSPDLWEEAMHFRELPGQGELPLQEILEVLLKTQDLRSVGPEALSDDLDKLSAVEAGGLAGRATRGVMTAAKAALRDYPRESSLQF
jgi:sugar phosphate isomerase/epimerase